MYKKITNKLMAVAVIVGCLSTNIYAAGEGKAGTWLTSMADYIRALGPLILAIGLLTAAYYYSMGEKEKGKDVVKSVVFAGFLFTMAFEIARKLYLR